MNLFYYKSKNGNVGDDLNAWLWPRIFGDLKDYRDITLVGIGSILDNRIESIKGEKIIFGTGIRDFLFEIQDQDSTKIKFVRGPISSKALGGVKFITDSAYCLKLVEPNLDYTKKYRVSYVPYFEHADYFNWNFFEMLTGIKVILPTLEVEAFLQEIAASEKVYCSAMHAAIFSDILRIPWCRVKAGTHGGEGHLTSELKWEDWLLSMKISNETVNLGLNFNGKNKKLLNQLIKIFLTKKILHGNHTFQLSDNMVLDEKVKQLALEIEALKSELRIKN